jgi:hypothetical protein
MAGKWIRPVRRLTIYLRDEFRCVYCGRNLHGADPQEITLDHVNPRVNGGHNSDSNLVTSCKSCNCARQDKPVSKWAGESTLKAIRRQTRRSTAKYRKLAESILSGECPDVEYSRWSE